jgi:hypothetical protein
MLISSETAGAILKRVFLVSLLLALIIGPFAALTDTILWLRGAHKYNPPITETEWQKLLQLPAAKLGLALAGREVRLTRMQWLRDSIGYPYFWKGLAKNNLVPTVAVFFACICIGRLESRRTAANDTTGSTPQTPG